MPESLDVLDYNMSFAMRRDALKYLLMHYASQEPEPSAARRRIHSLVHDMETNGAGEEWIIEVLTHALHRGLMNPADWFWRHP
jgi:hypothetical protein